MNAEPEPGAAPATPEYPVRLAIAQVIIFFGGLGTFGGAVMFIVGAIRATVYANAGGAMQAGGGFLLLGAGLLVVMVGLLLKPRRRTAPPNEPGA